VRSDGFAFAVRIGREVHGVRILRHLAKLGDDLFFAGDDFVFGLKIMLDIHAESLLRKVHDVSERSFDFVSLT